MQTILIIGSGFIGSRLAEKLSKDFKIVILDTFLRSKHEWVKDYATIITGDASLDNIVRSTFDRFKPDYVFLAAGNSLTKENFYDYILERRTIQSISNTIAKTTKDYGVKAIFLASSAEVYGARGRKEKITPNKEFPTTFTGELFYSTERFFDIHKEKTNIDFISFRYFSIYGDRYFLNPKEDLVSFMISQIKKKEPFVICRPYELIDILHTDDAIEATLLVFYKYLEGYKFSSNKINIGSGNSIRPIDIYNSISSFAAAEKPLMMNKNEKAYLVADISELISLGWNPKISLEDYLRGIYVGDKPGV